MILPANVSSNGSASDLLLRLGSGCRSLVASMQRVPAPIVHPIIPEIPPFRDVLCRFEPVDLVGIKLIAQLLYFCGVNTVGLRQLLQGFDISGDGSLQPEGRLLGFPYKVPCVLNAKLAKGSFQHLEPEIHGACINCADHR